MKRKIAVSVPEELVAHIEREVKAGRAASVSAYVSEAVARMAGDNELIRVLDQMDEEYGPPSKEAEEWARRVLRL
jgi:Arc/MetJ-type ribon-helix-helix transcriptional regulator